jgi:hypothetical protein
VLGFGVCGLPGACLEEFVGVWRAWSDVVDFDLARIVRFWFEDLGFTFRGSGGAVFFPILQYPPTCFGRSRVEVRGLSDNTCNQKHYIQINTHTVYMGVLGSQGYAFVVSG